MAIIWVSSVNGNDANSGLTKALAKATWNGVSGAISVSSAGDTFKVDKNHVETYTSAQTYSFPGTLANPCYVVSIDWTTEAYAGYVTKNLGSVTGVGIDWKIYGTTFFYGVYGEVGRSLVNDQVANRLYFENFRFDFVSDNNTRPTLGNTGGGCSAVYKSGIFDWTQRASAGKGFSISVADVQFIDVDFIDPNSVVPLLVEANGRGVYSLLFDGCDLTDFDTTLFSCDTDGVHKIKMVNCALNSGVTIHDTINHPDSVIEVIGCDNGTDNELYRMLRATHYGDVSHSDTIYRTNGATDDTNNISYKMVSGANALEFTEHLASFEMCGWIGSTGSKTFTAHINFDSATDLDDDELFIGLKYLGTAANTQVSFSDDRSADLLATPAAQTTSTEAWTGTGGFTNENKQEVSTTVTVNRVGYYRATVYLAKPSTTIYACPKVEVA